MLQGEFYELICIGILLLSTAIAYHILQVAIIKSHGKYSVLAQALGRDLKGKASMILYLLGMSSSFFKVWISGIIFVIVAVIWLIPDKRIEKALKQQHN